MKICRKKLSKNKNLFCKTYEHKVLFMHSNGNKGCTIIKNYYKNNKNNNENNKINNIININEEIFKKNKENYYQKIKEKY
jgi:hypothetical protein